MFATGIIRSWCMCGAPKSNNDQNITLKVRFHVISIVYQRNFINTSKILCRYLASRGEIAWCFKVSSTPKENNYKITEREHFKFFSSALFKRQRISFKFTRPPRTTLFQIIVHISESIFEREKIRATQFLRY